MPIAAVCTAGTVVWRIPALYTGTPTTTALLYYSTNTAVLHGFVRSHEARLPSRVVSVAAAATLETLAPSHGGCLRQSLQERLEGRVVEVQRCLKEITIAQQYEPANR